MRAVMSDQKLRDALSTCPAERITETYMKERIKDASFQKLGETGTLCTITLDNGYMVHGTSACVNVENYRQDIGEKISYENAFKQLWALFGFLLAEKNHHDKKQAA